MPGQAECRVLGHGRRAIPEPRIRPELAGIGATIRLSTGLANRLCTLIASPRRA